MRESSGWAPHVAPPSSAVPRRLRAASLGTATAVLGALEVLTRLDAAQRLPALAVVAVLAAATGVSIARPGIALGLAWAVAVVQVVSGVDGLLVELAVVVVLFHAGRWGSAATLWASGLSVPAVLGLAAVHVRAHGTGLTAAINVGTLARSTSRPLLVVGLTFLLLLIVPWLLGITLRMRAAARDNLNGLIVAEAQRAVAQTRQAEAEELARVKDEQARLVRDLHDVVGHSLALILAQAQSAEYVPEEETARIKAILRTIAAAARASLGDVRRVLSDTPDDETARLDALLASLAHTGRDVRPRVVGGPSPLPPDLANTAYRVLQEMTTNALKYGDRTAPITVTVDWTPPDLRLEVVNVLAPVAPQHGPIGSGRGLAGMRDRLAAVGGRLHTATADGVHTASALMPLPALQQAAGR